MSENTPMPPMATRRPRSSRVDRLLSTYGDDVTQAHDEVEDRDALEADLAWGVDLLAWMQELEGGYQQAALAGREGSAEQLALMPGRYRSWLGKAERCLAAARSFEQSKRDVAGVAELLDAIEEAKAILGNLEIADTFIPLAERLEMGGRGNPDPGRYGD